MQIQSLGSWSAPFRAKNGCFQRERTRGFFQRGKIFGLADVWQDSVSASMLRVGLTAEDLAFIQVPLYLNTEKTPLATPALRMRRTSDTIRNVSARSLSKRRTDRHGKTRRHGTGFAGDGAGWV